MAVTARPARCGPLTVKPLCTGLEAVCLAGLRFVPGLRGLEGQTWWAAPGAQGGARSDAMFQDAQVRAAAGAVRAGAAGAGARHDHGARACAAGRGRQAYVSGPAASGDGQRRGGAAVAPHVGAARGCPGHTRQGAWTLPPGCSAHLPGVAAAHDAPVCGWQDSPQAALSFAATTAQEQFTNWYLQFQNNPPYIFDLAYNFVNNFSAAANAVRARPAGSAPLLLQSGSVFCCVPCLRIAACEAQTVGQSPVPCGGLIRACALAADALQDFAQPGQQRRFRQADLVPERAQNRNQRPGLCGSVRHGPDRAAVPHPIRPGRCAEHLGLLIPQVLNSSTHAKWMQVCCDVSQSSARTASVPHQPTGHSSGNAYELDTVAGHQTPDTMLSSWHARLWPLPCCASM